MRVSHSVFLGLLGLDSLSLVSALVTCCMIVHLFIFIYYLVCLFYFFNYVYLFLLFYFLPIYYLVLVFALL